MARCLDCKHAKWERTANGRIKAKVPGRCQADLPIYPKMLCLYAKPVVHKGGIWPDMEGECTLFLQETP